MKESECACSDGIVVVVVVVFFVEVYDIITGKVQQKLK